MVVIVTAMAFVAAAVVPSRSPEPYCLAGKKEPAPIDDDPPPENPGSRGVDAIPVIAGEVPVFEIIADKPRLSLLKRVSELEKRKHCGDCKGRRKVVERVLVGFAKGDGLKKDPVYERQTFWCQTCKRVGYSLPDKLRQQLRLSVVAWSEVNRDAEGVGVAAENMKALLKEVATAQPWTAAGVVNDEVTKNIARGKLKVGDAVCLVGQVIADQPVSVKGHRSQIVSLLNAPNVSVLVLEPLDGDALLWNRVIAGGRFAGWVKGADGGQIAVVVRGFSFTTER